LIVAVIIVAAMGIAGTLKVMGKKPTGPGGAPAAAGGGAAGGRGGAGGPGGAGGRGGAVVSPAVVTQRIFTDRLDVQGVAKGRQSVTLTATGGQVVDRVLFKSGDRVRKGQVLLELRKDAEDAAISQAQASVDLAKSNSDRWNKLAAQGLAPAATAEQYQSAYITSKATLDAAKARLQDRVISAPFAGMVGLSDIAPGALISPGTAIVTLDDTSVITVDIDVPDRNLALIKEGVGIDATSDSYPGEHYSGRIAKIDTRIDERSRSFKARAELPNPGGRLKPGMLLHVGIDRGTHQGLAAPESAVQYSAGQASVYLISPRGGAGGAPGAPNAAGGGNARPAGQPAGSGAPAGAPAAPGAPGAGAAGPGGGRPGGGGFVALQRPIIAGIDECGFVEVKDGLVLGDRIVADGLNKLTPNQPITLGGFGRGGARGGPGAGPGGARGSGQAGGAPAGAPGAAGATAPGAGAGRQGGGQALAVAEAGRRGGAPGQAGGRTGAGMSMGAGRGEGRGPRAGGRGAQSVGVAAGNGASSRCATQQPMGRGGPGGPGGPGGGRGGLDAAAGGQRGGQPGGPGGEGRRGRGEGAMPAAAGPRGPGAGAGRGRGVETSQ
jgi:membrane fusion protein (multidrug efflux system)